MNVRAIVALAGAGVLAGSLRGWAHHSFDAEFDRNKPITVTGTVTKVEWTNPHARFYLDVRDTSGKVVNWDFELGSAAGMMRRGWTRNSLKYGDVVTVMGYAAKNAPYVANAYSVTLGDGRKLFAGSSIGGQPSVNSDERR